MRCWLHDLNYHCRRPVECVLSTKFHVGIIYHWNFCLLSLKHIKWSIVIMTHLQYVQQ